MTAIIDYAGIPLDGSRASTRALTRRLGRAAALLARVSGSPVPPDPEDHEPGGTAVDVNADTEPGE